MKIIVDFREKKNRTADSWSPSESNFFFRPTEISEDRSSRAVSFLNETSSFSNKYGNVMNEKHSKETSSTFINREFLASRLMSVDSLNKSLYNRESYFVGTNMQICSRERDESTAFRDMHDISSLAPLESDIGPEKEDIIASVFYEADLARANLASNWVKNSTTGIAGAILEAGMKESSARREYANAALKQAMEDKKENFFGAYLQWKRRILCDMSTELEYRTVCKWWKERGKEKHKDEYTAFSTRSSFDYERAKAITAADIKAFKSVWPYGQLE
jgi:hypothetical protein